MLDGNDVSAGSLAIVWSLEAVDVRLQRNSSASEARKPRDAGYRMSLSVRLDRCGRGGELHCLCRGYLFEAPS